MKESNLIACKACNATISARAESCPGCGEPGPVALKRADVQAARRKSVLSGVVTLLVLGGVAAVVWIGIKEMNDSKDEAARAELRELYPVLEACEIGELPSLRRTLRKSGEDLWTEASAARSLAETCRENDEVVPLATQSRRELETELQGQLVFVSRCWPDLGRAEFSEMTNAELRGEIRDAREKADLCEVELEQRAAE